MLQAKLESCPGVSQKDRSLPMLQGASAKTYSDEATEPLLVSHAVHKRT